jgi:hypothetical protein
MRGLEPLCFGAPIEAFPRASAAPDFDYAARFTSYSPPELINQFAQARHRPLRGSGAGSHCLFGTVELVPPKRGYLTGRNLCTRSP